MQKASRHMEERERLWGDRDGERNRLRQILNDAQL